MQALMLAAGMGKRLGNLTQNATKCMVCVNGKSLIEYALEALAQNGIKKFVMVVGYKAEVLKSFLKEKYGENFAPAGMSVEFIQNDVYDTTNNIFSLYLAREALCADDTILLESDLIFKPKIIADLISCDKKNVAVVSHFENWMDGTCALLNSDDEIVGIVDKENFDWQKIGEYYKTVFESRKKCDFSKRFFCCPRKKMVA